MTNARTKRKGARQVNLPARALFVMHKRARCADALLNLAPGQMDEARRRALIQRHIERLIRLSAPRPSGPEKQRRVARELLQLIEAGIYQGGVSPTPKAIRAFMKAQGIRACSANHLTEIIRRVRLRAHMLTLIADGKAPFTVEGLRAAFEAEKLSPPPDEFIAECLADNLHWKGYRGG